MNRLGSEKISNMKERILLLFIVLGLTAFIYIFQSYTIWGLAILVSLMAVYAIFTNIAYKIKQRKDLKSPPQRNENYKPFVSIMIPAHNEESVIANTIEISACFNSLLILLLSFF